MPARKPFFTWVEEKYDSPSQVPVRLQTYIQTIFKEGHTIKALSLATNLPEDWIATIVQGDSGETKPH